MKPNPTRLLARNAFHLGMGQVATTALGILLTAVVGRALGPAEFGVYFTIMTIFSFVYVIVDWGQATYVIRETARGRADEPELIGSALLLRLATTICASVIAVATAFVMGYDKHIVWLALLTVLVSLPVTLYAPFGYAFRGKDRMDIDVYATIASKLVLLIATVIALIFGGGLMEVILMQGIGGLASLLVGLFFVMRLKLETKAPEPKALLELFWQGTPIAMFSLVLAAQPFAEILILSVLAGPTVVGWYGASRTIFGIAISPAMISIGASFPELSRASLSLPDLRHMIEITGRVLFIVAALISSGLYVFAEHGVGIVYGYGRFEHAPSILRTMAIFIPLLFFVLLLASAMTAVGRNKAMLVISIARIALCSVLNWLLIDYWQRRFGNGAIILVIVAGLAEIPAIVGCLALLPRGAVSAATIVSLVRACVTAFCAALPLSVLQPLALWYLVPLYVLLFGLAAFATRLTLPSDLRLAIDFARTRIMAARR